MIIRLRRFSYAPTETEGVLMLNDGTTFATIEQPWVPNPNGALGGKPNHSCVPDGMYRLMPHKSKSKGDVFIFWNPELGVYKFPQDHEKDHGRNVCYLHAANWAIQLEGCVAPGLARQCMRRKGEAVAEPAVTSSGAAMNRLHKALGLGQHILSIESALGARE
jgi:hypothetical protein